MIKTEKYPVFTPNQVLSDGQLNKILTYLEPQDRATRTLGIGRGILCGFEMKISKNSIKILPGVGLTSAGFIFSIPKSMEFQYCLPFTPTDQYSPFLAPNSTDHIELLELVETHDPEDASFIALSGLALEDYVISIFLNEYEFDLTTCLPENCDNQGAEKRLEWRFLLLKKADALGVIQNADERLGSAVDEAEVTAILHARYELKKLTLRRPLLGATNVVRYSTLTHNYSEVCRAELTRFKDALTAAYDCYKLLIGKENINQALDSLYTHFRKLRDGRGLQYFWDFLDDLFHAYNEFIDQAFLLTSVCGVVAGTYSHHLFLGPGENLTSCRPTIYRHFFTPACEDYFYGDLPGEVVTLFQRILLLIKGFTWKPGLEKLRITPQRLGRSFEDRAIPHYLTHDLVKTSWSLAAKRRCQQDQLASYHREDDGILQENLSDFNHLRIEGHMYRKKDDVLKEIEALRASYNLPFAVKCLELGLVPEFSGGGCSIGGLRILYDITRLDVLCFVEDKIRFLNSIVADDLEFDSVEEELAEREKERIPTRIEASKKLDYSEVIDFGRNRVFTIQRRKAQKKGAWNLLIKTEEASAEALDMRATELFVDLPKTASVRSVVYESTNTTVPYAGRKQSRFEKDFDYSELDKVEVPRGVKEIVGRKTATPRKSRDESFEKQLAPRADAVKKETPVEEDNTSFTIKAREVAFAFPKTPVTDYIKYPKDELGDRLLSELVGNLMKLLEDLPEEVHLFDSDAVQETCAVIKDKALALKDIVEELLGSQDYAPKGVEYALISELLELADACIEMRLGRIVELHNNEWQAAENSSILADYIKKHPAIHHCGGVHIGGTHVLVSGYIDKVREIKKIKELTRPLFIKAPLAVYKELRGNVYENVLRTAGHFNRKAFTWSKRIDKERIEDKTLARVAPAPAITLDRERSVLLDGLLRKIESSSDEELILFDFCHQYICCSDCSSVEYVVIAELKLYLPKLAFCIDDLESYAFGVYPPGGVVTGSGVKKIKETYHFIPAGSSVGAQLFTYEFGGRKVQLVANVSASPQAGFSFTVINSVVREDGIATAVIVQFTNLSLDADEFHWDFGDGLTSKEDSPVHTFDLSTENSFKVTLTAMTEACRDETFQEFSQVPTAFYIEKHLTEFCHTDTAAYKLVVEPADGELVANAAIDIETQTFHPDRVDLAGEQKATVELFYKVSGQEVSLSLDVYALPQPAFSYEIFDSNEKVVFVRFINKTVDGSEYTWDFGDGATSSRPEPTHEYLLEAGTSFTVTLTALNGPCQASSSLPVSVSRLLLEFGDKESTGQFCETDEVGIDLIGTPAGGTFSGAGVKENRFIPGLVSMGELSKKTVMLQYHLAERSTTLRAVVYKKPVLSFNTRVSPAQQGVNVTFTNQSLYAEKYLWNFGDESGEFTGYNISHFYKTPGAYQVVLRGLNPNCENTLSKTVVAKIDDSQQPELLPVAPLKILMEMLASSKVKGLLLEFGVNGAYLDDFYRQMTKIVSSGNEKEITTFAMDEFPFIGLLQEIITLGGQMHRSGRGLPENTLQVLIDVYRLSTGNLLNLQSKRSADLGSASKLHEGFKKLIELTETLNPHLGFEKFPTKGFELVPQSRFDGMPILQGYFVALGKSL
ncbi:MAG: PKD domain-containing protein [Desulfovibrionaceae bacterium]|nr:PKD domain-containing protein [Desulfovibrionaceae bacterium]